MAENRIGKFKDADGKWLLGKNMARLIFRSNGQNVDTAISNLENDKADKSYVDDSIVPLNKRINDTRGDVDNLINDMDSKADKTETDNKISEIETSLNSKQDILVDGTNIKTINGEPILGEGNLVIQGGGSDVIMEDNPESGVDLRVNGTVRTLAQTSELLDGLPSESFEDNFALNNQGNKVYDTNYYVSTPIPIDAKSRITWYTNGTNGSYTLCGYDSAMNFTEYWTMNANPRTITLSHANTAYIRATFYKGTDNVHNGKITNSSGDVIYQADMSTNIDGLVNLNTRLAATESKIALINKELPTKQDNLYLNSNDEVIVDVNSKPYVLSDKNMLLNGVDNNNYEDNMYINGNGSKVVSSDFVISKKIPISSGTKITWYPGATMPASSTSPSICEFNINDSKIQYWTMNANPRTLTLNGSGTTYIIASFAKNGTEGSGKIVNANTGEIIYQIENKGKLDGLEGLNSKIDELQLFKFPNATIIGEPTINNGQISGFSATSYLKFPFLVDFQSRPFEINMEFTTGSNIQNQENIFDSDFGLAFAIRNGKFVIAISTNGTSWNLGEGVGTHTVLANTTYRVKLWWDRMTYHLSYSTDGGKNYTEDITKVGAYQPAPKQMYIGAGENFGEVFNWFTGIINMNHCTLSILDQIIWSGMDDAGLATRLETDMSNIDQAGINYINGLIEANVPFKFISLTKEEYDALETKDPNTIYLIGEQT